MAWVFEHSPTKGAERLVLLSLANHADGDGRCWPSMQTVIKETRLNDQTVKRAVHDLHAAGHLTRVQNGAPGGHTNLYVLQLGPPKVVESAPPSEVSQGGASDTGKVVESAPPNHQEPSDVVSLSRVEGTPTPARRLDLDFLDWWPHYPSRMRKREAIPAYREARLRGCPHEDLVAAADNYTKILKRRPDGMDFVMGAKKFLDYGHEDYLPGGAALEPGKPRGYTDSDGTFIQT